MLKTPIKTSCIFFLFSFSLVFAGDRPEDVMLKADRAIQRVIQSAERDDMSLPTSHLMSSREYILNTLEGLGMPVADSKVFQENQKKFNIQLFNSFNAAISLLSDYLHQAMTDHDLSWSYENSFLLDGQQEKLSIDGYSTFKDPEDESNEPQILLMSHSILYEIERQRYCLNLTFHLDLFIYWKSKIFPQSTPHSYSKVNAHAIAPQIKMNFNQLSSCAMPPLPKLKNIATDYITLMYQELVTALPQQTTHLFTATRLHTEKSIQRKIERTKKAIKDKKNLYERDFNESSMYVMYLNIMLTQLCRNPLECIKNNHFETALRNYYNCFQEQRLRISKRGRKISDPLNIEQFFSPLRPIELKLHPPKSMTPLSPVIKLDVVKDTPVFLKEKEPIETETVQPLPPLIEDTPEILYGSDYWRAEHQRHQQRKKDTSQKSKSPSLSPYEIDLYHFLKDNIFKVNSSLKVRKLIKALANLHFEVKANPRGNGSVHYVSPTVTNPLFANDLEYATAYFNIHLPSENIPLPYDYYRFLKSGFSNVFGLTLEFINQQLEDSLSMSFKKYN